MRSKIGENKRKEKNYFVEMCRFVFSICLVFHHCRELGGGRSNFFAGAWIFVEFFFLISGYYTMKHYDENESNGEDTGQEAVTYVWKKIRTILPYAAIGILISVLQIVILEKKNAEWFSLSVSILWNILCLQETCLATYNLNAPMWYITDIMLFLPLIIILILALKDIYKFYLSWLIPIFCYIFLIQNNGTLQFWGGQQMKVMFSCFLRGIASMMLGTFVYFWCQKITEINHEKVKIHVVVKWIFLCGFIYAVITYDLKKMSMDMIICLLLFLFSIFLAEPVRIPKGIATLCEHLGRLALPVYLIHRPLIEFFKMMQVSFGLKVFLCLSCTIIVSEMTMGMVNKYYRKKA